VRAHKGCRAVQEEEEEEEEEGGSNTLFTRALHWSNV
jgi:hypothetical protein